MSSEGEARLWHGDGQEHSCVWLEHTGGDGRTFVSKPTTHKCGESCRDGCACVLHRAPEIITTQAAESLNEARDRFLP